MDKSFPLRIARSLLRFLTSRLLLALLVLTLLTSNLLTLVNVTVHDALFSALAAVVPARWLRHSPTQKQLDRIGKAKKIHRRILKRNVRNLAVNTGSIAAEAVPVTGIATVVTVTAMDIKDACDDAKDLDELINLFETTPPSAERETICGYTIDKKWRRLKKKWRLFKK